jgi:DNA-binding transcriptional LysR family regulator
LITGAGEHETEVTGNLCTNSIEAVRAAALKGQGVCLLPLLSVAEDLKTGRLLRLLPDYAAVESPKRKPRPGGDGEVLRRNHNVTVVMADISNTWHRSDVDRRRSESI